MDKAKGASRGRIPASEESPVQKYARGGGFTRVQRGDLGEAAFLLKATSLGLTVAKPWGNKCFYDFMVDGGGRLLRVQVKSTAYMTGGMYHVGMYHRPYRKVRPYAESEIDFAAVYIVPEETWYLLPVEEVAERTNMLFRPKGWTRRDPYAKYREAWHLLREPDGLIFG
jgi:hypothetical protein